MAKRRQYRSHRGARAEPAREDQAHDELDGKSSVECEKQMSG